MPNFPTLESQATTESTNDKSLANGTFARLFVCCQVCSSESVRERRHS